MVCETVIVPDQLHWHHGHCMGLGNHRQRVRNFEIEMNRLQCVSCGGCYVVTSAPVMLELKRIDYNENERGGKYVVTSAPAISELKQINYNLNHAGDVLW